MMRLPLWLILVLAGVLTAELWVAEPWQTPGGPPPLASRSPAPASPVMAPVSAAERPSDPVPVLLARPLFTPGRRPPSVVPVTVEAAPAPLPRLAGVLVHGASRRAILVLARGGKPVVVAEGARVEAFAVERIEPGQVTLAGPGGTRVLYPTFGPLPSSLAARAAAGPIAGLPEQAGLSPVPAGPISGIAGLPPPPVAAR